MFAFKKSLTLLALVGIGSTAYAQPITSDRAGGSAPSSAVNSSWAPSLVKDGVIDYYEHVNKAVDWSHIRENDVAWAQRIWRQIDVRQKQNQAFIYEGDEFTGGGAFIEILLDLIKKGKVQAYNAIDDRFSMPLTRESLEQAIGGGWDTVNVEDPITGEFTQKITKKEFDINKVTKYQLKEDWVFDRNLGKLVVRIVGIAPVLDRYDESTGEFKYSTPMFWVYYPEARKELVSYEVYNPTNMVKRMNWSEFFDGRFFSSYIVRSSMNNPTGRRIENGLNGLYEGQEILEGLMNRESDMWEH